MKHLSGLRLIAAMTYMVLNGFMGSASAGIVTFDTGVFSSDKLTYTEVLGGFTVEITSPSEIIIKGGALDHGILNRDDKTSPYTVRIIGDSPFRLNSVEIYDIKDSSISFIDFFTCSSLCMRVDLPDTGVLPMTFDITSDASLSYTSFVWTQEAGRLFSDNWDITVVPLPASIMLMGSGLIGVFALYRYRFMRS